MTCTNCGIDRQTYEALVHENADLRREVRGEDYRIPAHWNLSMMRADIMRLLLGKAVVSLHDFLALRDLRNLPELGDEQKNFQVLIHSLRRRVKPHGVVIRTHWGRGYSLQDREAWKERLHTQPLRQGGES